MGVFIDEFTTDVRVDAEASVEHAEASSVYEEAVTRRMSDMHEAMVRRRTSSESFDD